MVSTASQFGQKPKKEKKEKRKNALLSEEDQPNTIKIPAQRVPSTNKL